MMKNIKRKHKLFKFQREKNLPIGGHYNARQTMEREVRTEKLSDLKKYIKIEVNKNFWNCKISISETISKSVSPLLSFPFLCLVNWTQDVPARDGGQLRVLRPPHQAAPQRAPAVEPEWSQAGAGQTCQADGRQSSHSQQAWGRPGLVSAQDGVRHRLCGQEEVPARLHWRSQDEGLHLC